MRQEIELNFSPHVMHFIQNAKCCCYQTSEISDSLPLIFQEHRKRESGIEKINVRQYQRLRYETYFSRWLDLLFSQQSPCGNCCKLNSKSEGKTFLLHLVLCWLSCLLWRQTGDFCELLDFGLHGVWFIIKTIHTHYH